MPLHATPATFSNLLSSPNLYQRLAVRFLSALPTSINY